MKVGTGNARGIGSVLLGKAIREYTCRATAPVEKLCNTTVLIPNSLINTGSITPPLGYCGSMVLMVPVMTCAGGTTYPRTLSNYYLYLSRMLRTFESGVKNRVEWVERSEIQPVVGEWNYQIVFVRRIFVPTCCLSPYQTS